MRESVTARMPIGRPLILLALAFVVGAGLGWVISRPFAHSSASPVSDVDYVAVVAQLFERDHNEAIARERLALLGSPSTLVQQALAAAQSGKLKDPSDQAALRALAQAIAPGAAADAASSSTTQQSSPPGPRVVATPASGLAPTPSAEEHGSLLGPILAFLLAFSLGALVLLRTAGLSLPLRRLSPSWPGGRPPIRSTGPESPPPSAGFAGSAASGPTPLRRLRHLSTASVPEEAEIDLAVEEAPAAAARPQPAGARTATLTRSRPAVVRPTRRLSFQSSYRRGDDPFDEIHPITDPSTGALVAACGLSAALRHEGAVLSHYYAFTAWVQDYVSGEELRAVGLVTPAALHTESTRIEEWVRDGAIDDVLAAEPGASAELRTDTVAATVTVVAVDHGRDADETTAFAGLTVHFDVCCGGDAEDD